MGTRGAYGFRIDGEDKVTYNHFDSYPNYLGVEVMKFVKNTSLDELRDIAKGIVLIDSDSQPNEEQIEECKKYADTGVSTGELDEWYVLLRNIQGDLSVYKEGLKYMIDSHAFLSNSLFCEWAYIINLDTESLEIYRGFNKRLGGEGRYANLGDVGSEYFGVVLLREIPISEIQDMTCEEILKLCNEIEKEDEEEE